MTSFTSGELECGFHNIKNDNLAGPSCSDQLGNTTANSLAPFWQGVRDWLLAAQDKGKVPPVIRTVSLDQSKGLGDLLKNTVSAITRGAKTKRQARTSNAASIMAKIVFIVHQPSLRRPIHHR